MIFFFGTRQYGKVDQVPGLFYVSTKFFYIQFIPLIPVGSYLVFDGTETDKGFRGCQIPLNGKSILFAWLRLALLLGGSVLAFLALLELADTRKADGRLLHLVVFLIAAPLSFVFFWLSYRIAHAGPMRALRIASHAGIPPEALAPYFLHSQDLPALEAHADVPPAEEDNPFKIKD